MIKKKYYRETGVIKKYINNQSIITYQYHTHVPINAHMHTTIFLHMLIFLTI